MRHDQAYEELMNMLINDPPENRWRSVRALSGVNDQALRNKIAGNLKLELDSGMHNEMVNERIQLALRMINAADNEPPYNTIDNNENIYSQLTSCGNDDPENTEYPFTVADFHVHPKQCDAQLLADFSGMRAVVLATDTDPADMDDPAVIEHIRKTYQNSDISRYVGFDYLIEEIRKSLRSVTHVSNQDVADWVSDYPESLIGFGSVDLCKSEGYVLDTLEWIKDHGLRGIKLLPFSQFFDPAESSNADLMMEFCSKHGLIVLSHTGCSAGVFESPYLNMHSRPSRWAKLARKYPDVPIVLAHFGSYSEMMPGIWFDEAIELMKECSNVYSDTAAVWRLLWNEEMVSIIRENGLFGQVLFGTDYPMPRFLPGGERGTVMSILENDLLTEDEKKAVLGGNAARLIGD